MPYYFNIKLFYPHAVLVTQSYLAKMGGCINLLYMYEYEEERGHSSTRSSLIRKEDKKFVSLQEEWSKGLTVYPERMRGRTEALKHDGQRQSQKIVVWSL